MISSTLGTKLQMSQVYLQDGKRFGVTKLKLVPATVLMSRTTEKDGYEAVQIGFGSAKKNTQPVTGHLKKVGVTSPVRQIKEVVASGDQALEAGQAVAINDIFTPGDVVSVSALSKGRGYAGVIKRHGFHGGPKTHGQSDRHRAPGSVGAGTTPGRVYKGKRMAGRMGHTQVTVTNLLVLDVDVETGILTVSGSVPGARNTDVMITKTGHKEISPVVVPAKLANEPASEENTTEETPNQL